MKNVLIFSTEPPYPKTVGKAVVWGGIFDYLKQRDDLKIHVISFAPKETTGENEILVERPGFLEVFFNILLKSIISRKISIQECFFFSRRTVKLIRQKVNELQPDIIIYDTIRTQQFRSYFQTLERTKSITYLDDLFSLRYLRVLDSRKHGGIITPSILGNFSEKLPRVFRAIFLRSETLRFFVLKGEASLVARSEKRALLQSNFSLLVSPAEVEYANGLHSGTAVYLPPRLGLRRGITSSRTWAGAPTYLFLGSLNLAHNVEGLKWFLSDCLPLLLKVRPDARIKIIGKTSSSELANFLNSFGSAVDYLGFVDDVGLHLVGACAMISPLTFGSGIKIKVIEAFRAGLPVVATPIALEGVQLDDRSDSPSAFSATSAQEFVDAMIALLDTDTNSRSSYSAKNSFEKNYSDNAVDSVYDEVFDVQ